MKLIELLRNSFLNNLFSKKIRNFLGIFPSYFNFDANKLNQSVSDAFIWRTDNGYHTVFKFSDILKLFFNDSTSNVHLDFFDKNGKMLKSISLNSISLSNEIKIDKSFFENLEDYGTFYIYHRTDNNLKTVIRNSCYTGYSYFNNLPSFVHGNLISSIKNFKETSVVEGVVARSIIKERIYCIQNSFKNKLFELALINSSNSEIYVKINNTKFFLQKGQCKIIKLDNLNFVKIISNSYLLRPIIFEKKEGFLDVYHG